MSKRIVFLAGLPRSGSTLVANLLAHHESVHATPSSPLSGLVKTLRSSWSSDPMLLAQLDSDFDVVYARLLRSTRAFIEAWSGDTECPIVIDKHRGWLYSIETLRVLYPDFKMIVCLRDLRDVYASIERQHRRTLLLTFADGLEQDLVDARAAQLFASGGIVGGPLRALHNLGDLVDPLPHLFFVQYEKLVAAPERTLRAVFEWLDLEPPALDLAHIIQRTTEADSFYRFKYPHRLKDRLVATTDSRVGVSPRVLDAIVTRFGWYYRTFYKASGVDLDALKEPAAVGSGADPTLADAVL